MKNHDNGLHIVPEMVSSQADMKLPVGAIHDAAWYWENAALLWLSMENGIYRAPGGGRRRFVVPVTERGPENYGGNVCLDEIAFRLGYSYGYFDNGCGDHVRRGKKQGYRWHPGPDDDNPPVPQERIYPDWFDSPTFVSYVGKLRQHRARENEKVKEFDIAGELEGILGQAIFDIEMRMRLAREGLCEPIPVKIWITNLPKLITSLARLKTRAEAKNVAGDSGISIAFIRQYIDMLQDPASRRRNAQILASFVANAVPADIMELALKLKGRRTEEAEPGSY